MKQTRKYNPFNLDDLFILLSKEHTNLHKEIYDYFSYIREHTWDIHTKKERLELVNKLERFYTIEDLLKMHKTLESVAWDYSRKEV